jgi:hypothetical protein
METFSISMKTLLERPSRDLLKPEFFLKEFNIYALSLPEYQRRFYDVSVDIREVLCSRFEDIFGTHEPSALLEILRNVSNAPDSQCPFILNLPQISLNELDPERLVFDMETYEVFDPERIILNMGKMVGMKTYSNLRMILTRDMARAALHVDTSLKSFKPESKKSMDVDWPIQRATSPNGTGKSFLAYFLGKSDSFTLNSFHVYMY